MLTGFGLGTVSTRAIIHIWTRPLRVTPAAYRILRRLEFHYTSKHAGWLNVLEIKIGVSRGRCPDHRVGEHGFVIIDIDAWQRQRDARGALIKWKFSAQKPWNKLALVDTDFTQESQSLRRGAGFFVCRIRCFTSGGELGRLR